MASQPPQPNAPASQPAPATPAQKIQVLGIVLLVAAVAFAAVPVVLAVRAATAVKPAAAPKTTLPETPKDATAEAGPTWLNALGPTFFWGLLCAVICVGGGLVCLLPAEGQKLGEAERMRLILLVVGANLGILTAALGMALPFTHDFSEIFTGGAEEWKKKSWAFFIVAGALIGGFAVAFASLQLARGVERENARMRRLLYGFGTVFTVVLLIAVLLLINLLPYIPTRFDPLYPFLNATFDWTQSRLYSLSDRSRATLTGLKEPVKAYVFLDANDPVGDEVVTMLQNCRGATPQISWETVSSLEKKRIQELAKQYREKMTEKTADDFGQPVLALRQGVLLVYGTEGQERASFLPRESLVSGEQGTKEIFLGEAVLMKAIRSLAEGKVVIYFTQGDEEMDYNGLQADATDQMGGMVMRMKHLESYELKDLKFEAGVTEVPKDADVVVVARPGRLKPEALKALAGYMGFDYNAADDSFTASPNGRKGKLFVLMGVNLANNQMVHTKLEPLLEKFGVQVPDSRALSLETPGNPTEVDVATNPASDNKIAKAFGAPNRTIFQFDDVRPIQPAPGGAFNAESLAVVVDESAWVESNLSTSPKALARERAKNPRIDATPISVAVAVSEQSGVPPDAIHAGVAGTGGPRLVVFGNAQWISNADLITSTDNLQRNSSLFTSCISWLRGDPDIGAAPEDVDENKVRPQFSLGLRLPEYVTTLFLPGTHMLLAVVAAGFCVWLVRRR